MKKPKARKPKTHEIVVDFKCIRIQLTPNEYEQAMKYGNLLPSVAKRLDEGVRWGGGMVNMIERFTEV